MDKQILIIYSQTYGKIWINNHNIVIIKGVARRSVKSWIQNHTDATGYANKQKIRPKLDYYYYIGWDCIRMSIKKKAFSNENPFGLIFKR